MSRSLCFLLFIIMTSCTNYGQLQLIADLPTSLEETSGMVSFGDSTVWIIEDKGNKDEIYQVNFKGTILKSLKIINGDNDDWEDLAKDKDGNVYIGDFGNNANHRKNLVIYKIPNPSLEPGDKIDAEKIEFYYPNQKEFPPKKDALFFDAESLFHHENKLFIVTKNRSDPFNGEAQIYTVPDVKGNYEATLVGTFAPCTDWELCQITSIAISPKGDKIVALSYGKLFIFTNFTWDDFSKGSLEEIDLGVRTQLESIIFIDENTVLLSDERSKGSGGNLYCYTLK